MMDKRIKYWCSLFPEIKDKDNIFKIVLLITGKSMEDYAKEYDKIQEDLCSWVGKNFFNRSIEIEESKRYKIYISQYKWIGFFTPVLKKYYKEYYKIINENSFIKDKSNFLLDFERSLIEKMINMSYRVLVLETQIAKEDGELIGNDEYERGKFFYTNLLWNYNYVRELYFAYPELIRLLDQLVRNIITFLREILEDYEKIFLSYGKLLNIKWGKGDFHNNGKTVIVLICENGKVVYKPRSMALERVYSELLEWFSKKNKYFMKIDSGKAYDLKFGSYMEFIENTECSSQEDVSNFYYRMGELLCILYTLNSKDFHCENVIACGDMPILVDLETLVHSSITFYPDQSIIYSARDMISDSVIGTALLPTLLQNNKTEDAIEIGGMGSGRIQKSPYKTQIIESSDSENIKIRFENRELNRTLNYPIYHGKIVNCSRYLDTVKKGFENTYKWICKNKIEYCQKIERLLETVAGRVICKNTNIYTQLLETGLHPDLLHNSCDRLVYLCRLGIIMEQNEDYENYRIYQCEFQDLKEGDVPYFTSFCSTNTLIHGAQEISINGGIRKNIIEVIKNKIKNMNMIDMDRQVALINQSYIGSKLLLEKPSGTGNAFHYNNMESDNFLPIEVGEKIGKICIARGCTAQIGNHEEMTWIGMRGFGDGFYNITPVGFNVYQGNAGISIFLYHLGIRKSKYMRFFYSSMRSVISNLFLELKKGIYLENMGAITGFVSEIYFINYLLKRGIDLCNDVDLNYIVEKSIMIVKKNLDENNSLDFLSGIAGILGVYLGTIPYLKKEQQNKVIRFLEELVQRIKERAVKVEEGIYTWGDRDDIGYAHGNSGIITQLYRYYQVSNDNEIFKLIEGAIKYERKYHFNYQKDQWLFKENVHYYSWCNGIAGLLLCKLYLFHCGYKDDLLKGEISKLIDQLIETGFGTDLSICHGDMGTIQILLYAANILQNHLLKSSCIKTCKDVAYNLVNNNWDRVRRLEDWGLMAGITGVGMGFVAENIDIIDILLLE